MGCDGHSWANVNASRSIAESVHKVVGKGSCTPCHCDISYNYVRYFQNGRTRLMRCAAKLYMEMRFSEHSPVPPGTVFDMAPKLWNSRTNKRSESLMRNANV
jgi:hypothetical protein